jgi:hypothetical protein
MNKQFHHYYSSCQFKNQKIKLVDTGEPSRNFEKCIFDECIVEGLRMDHHMLKNTNLNNCSGFVLIDDRAIQNLEFTNILGQIRRIGRITFSKRGNLYYLPESTWAICNHSFANFEDSLKKTA